MNAKTLALINFFRRLRGRPPRVAARVVPPAAPAAPTEAVAEVVDVTAPNLVVSRHANGFDFMTPPGDFSTISLAILNDYERYVLGPLLADAVLVRNAIDVGANVGLIALPLSKLISGKVFCFELSPRNAKLLANNVFINKIENIRVFPIAIGDVLDSKLVFINKHTTLNIFNQNYVGTDILSDTVQIVPTMTLDAIFSGDIPIDLIKIDVDGWDYQALCGAQMVIKRWQPLIYTEYCPELIAMTTGRSGEDFVRILTDRGYAATVLGPNVPVGPAPTTSPRELAAHLAGLLALVAATPQRHIDIRWHLPAKHAEAQAVVAY